MGYTRDPINKTIHDTTFAQRLEHYRSATYYKGDQFDIAMATLGLIVVSVDHKAWLTKAGKELSDIIKEKRE